MSDHRHLPKFDCLVLLDDETFVDVQFARVGDDFTWSLKGLDTPLELDRVVTWWSYPEGRTVWPDLLPAKGCLVKGKSDSFLGGHWQHVRFSSALDRDGNIMSQSCERWAELPEVSRG